MKAYKVTWQSFDMKHDFSVLNSGWAIKTYEKFFGTKEAADEFVSKKNKAAQDLDLYPTLTANVQEVELE